MFHSGTPTFLELKHNNMGSQFQAVDKMYQLETNMKEIPPMLRTTLSQGGKLVVR